MGRKSNTILEFVGAIATVGLATVVAAAALTMWGVGQSRERTECYKTAAAVSDCGQPGVAERVLRTILGPKAVN